MNDLDLPPRAPLPVETRDRIRATVVAGLDESPRPGRKRWYQPLAAAAGIVVLATAAVVVVTQTVGEPTGDNRPTTTELDTFATECVQQANASWPADEQGWTVVAATMVRHVGVLTLRGQDKLATCEARQGFTALYQNPPHRIPEPSDAPDLWLRTFGNATMVPPLYPLMLSGPVSGQVSGMTLTLNDGTTVEADVAKKTAVAMVPWDGPTLRGGTTVPTKDLIVSVRVVDADGVVLYEGPPASTRLRSPR
jgi:hypothetical protein